MSDPEPRPQSVGLCFTCRHARRVETPRSSFWLCRLSATDPAFPRYPRLPVLACSGWRPPAAKNDAGDETAGGSPQRE